MSPALREFRYGLAILLAGLGVLASAFAGAAWFTRDTIYDSDSFVDATEGVFATEGVQRAIAENVTEAVFEATGFTRPEPVEEEPTPTAVADDQEAEDEAEATDPAFGEAIAEALGAQTTELAIAVTQRPAVKVALDAALRDTHDELLSVIDRTDNADIEIDLDPVLRATVAQLARDDQLSFLSELEIQPGLAVFVVAHDAQGGSIWWRFLRSFDDWAVRLVVFTIVSIVLAIVVSPERDRLLLGTGTGLATVALINIGFLFSVRKLAGSIFIRDDVSRGAFDEVFAALASPLIRLQVTIAILGLVMLVVGAALGFYISRFRGETVWAGHEQPTTLDFTPGGGPGGY